MLHCHLVAVAEQAEILTSMKKTALICGAAAAAAVAVIGIRALGPEEHQKTDRDAGKVGKVLVRTVPVNLLVVRSIHLMDGNGNTALKAKF